MLFFFELLLLPSHPHCLISHVFSSFCLCAVIIVVVVVVVLVLVVVVAVVVVVVVVVVVIGECTASNLTKLWSVKNHLITVLMTWWMLCFSDSLPIFETFNPFFSNLTSQWSPWPHHHYFPPYAYYVLPRTQNTGLSMRISGDQSLSRTPRSPLWNRLTAAQKLRSTHTKNDIEFDPSRTGVYQHITSRFYWWQTGRCTAESKVKYGRQRRREQVVC